MDEKRHILYSKTGTLPKTKGKLPRPGLDAIIKDALTKPLVLVTAGAGFGKTQAVSSALVGHTQRLSWLQLTELDNLCVRLWERIVYSYSAWNPTLGNALESLGFPITAQAFDQYIRLVADAIGANDQWVFVLDDFHMIYEPEILRFVERMAFSSLQNLSFVIISRTKPEISVAAMMAKDLLVRITEKELRFTQNETSAYYENLNIELSKEQNEKLYQYTDGWAIAIYLVGLSIKNNGLPKGHVPNNALEDLFNLIEQEIFLTRTPALQNLLVRASLLDDLPMGLLRIFAKDNTELLDEFLQIGLLVRDEASLDKLRFHHLLQEFLAAKQSSIEKPEIEESYLTAAKWFQNAKDDIGALQYYVKGGFYLDAYNIILQYSMRVPAELASLFINVIEQSPKECIEKRPIMKVVRAKFVLNNGGIKECVAELSRIKAHYEAQPQTPENSEVLGEVYLLMGILCFILKTLDFPAFFKKADELLPGGSAILDEKMMLVGSGNYCIIKENKKGELQKLQNAFFEGMPYASRVMHGCGAGLEYLVAGEAAYFTGEIKTAEENAHLAIAQAKQKKQLDIEFSASYLLCRIYCFRGDYKSVDLLLKSLRQKKLYIPECISMYDLIEAGLLYKVGCVDQIARWIVFEEPTNTEKDAPISLGIESLVRASVCFHKERYSEAIAIAKQMLPVFEERGLLLGMVCYYVIQAVSYHYMGNREKALKSLETSYQLSWQNNVIMLHVEIGGPMRSLISAAREDPACTIPREWLDAIFTKASTYAKRKARLKVDYNLSNGQQPVAVLSKLEKEILWDLCQGLSREEIAESCSLSVNTIKSTLKSIYNKLGASSAFDAVRIATFHNLF